MNITYTYIVSYNLYVYEEIYKLLFFIYRPTVYNVCEHGKSGCVLRY